MTAKLATSPHSPLAAMDVQRDETAPEAFAPTPIYARTTARRRNNPAIWAIVLVAALAIGVGAFVMKTPKDDLMVSTASPPASATPLAPQLAQNTPTMAPEAPAKDVRTFKSESVRTPVARTATAKPAPHKALAARKAVNADAASADASATVPAAPMPYAPVTQAPAPVVAAPPPAAVVTPEVVAPPAPTPEATPQG